MRRRVYRVFSGAEHHKRIFASDIERATGCIVPQHGYGASWSDFFEDSELRDFLDALTVIAVRLRELRWQSVDWVGEVEQIFREENVGYTIQPNGEVHYAQDAEFQRNRQSTVAGLGAPRYRAALAHFEAAQKALDTIPPQTREAIRQTYEATETVFRLIFPEVSLLGPAEVEKRFRPLALEALEGTERDCLTANVTAFKDWVIGAQGYRHGKGTEDPDNPSISTTVLCVSAGASYLRWLVEIDAVAHAKNQTTTGD